MKNSERRLGVAAAAMVLAAGAGHGLAQVQFRSEPDAARPVMSAQQISQNLQGLALRADASRVVVQFDRAILPAEREDLRRAGVVLQNYLGDHAYVANLDAGRLDARRALAAAPMGSVRPIRTAWKLHRMFNADEVPQWTVVGGDEADPTVALYAMFHRDVSLDGANGVAAQFGAHVVGEVASVNALVLEMPYGRIKEMAGHDDVLWMEPALPPMKELNDSNRVITQVDEVQAAPYELDGSGVTVFVYDGGRVSLHQDLAGRVTHLPNDGSGNSSHATHVAGTVGGTGVASSGRWAGMAPNVDILSSGFEQVGGLRQGFLYSDPGDLEQDYGEAISRGAHISNNSIGTNTAANGFPCDWEGDYSITDALIDEVVNGSLGGPIIVVWANGNERGSGRCGTQYHTTAPPACAKNHITVGALNSNNDSMTSFSSWGDTDDGRMKPDVSAPGCQSGGDNGVTSSTGSGSSYSTFCGTSMASPTTAGIAALILEDYRVQFSGRPDPIASTMKVLLAHTAHDLGNPGPDNQFGYGSVRVKDAVDFMRMAQFQELSIGQGEVHEFEIEVEPGTAELKYTMSWMDPSGTPLVSPALVNNLDVRAIDPLGNVHYAWTLDQNNPGAPAQRNQPNTKDNIEQVYVQSPMAGTWTIEVAGTNVPEGPQVYSIAGTPQLNVSLVGLQLVSEVPPFVGPGEELDVEAQVFAINDEVVPGSEQLHYRMDGGSFISVPLQDAGDVLVATIPGAGCGDVPEFYLSIEGVNSGLVTVPSAGPAGPFSYDVLVEVVSFHDNFESDLGWTTAVDGASSGHWERGVPVNDPNWDYDPTSDGDGSGSAFLTENRFGNTDVDNGAVLLTSPRIDMSTGGALEYIYFLRLTDSNSTDFLLVEISDDDGTTWRTLHDHRQDRGLNWTTVSVSEDEIRGLGLDLTDTMRLRYTARDADPQTIVEAGVDGVIVRNYVCDDPGCPADMDGDGDADVDDFFTFLDLFVAGDPAADINGDGSHDVDDFFAYLDLFAAGC